MSLDGSHTEGLTPEAIAAAQDRRRPFFKRRAVLLTVGVVVVGAITVVSDLPIRGSRTSQITQGNTVISAVNSDLASCAYAVKEAFLIHDNEVSGTLTPSERSQSPGLLSDDEDACSFTDDNIYELANIEVPGSAAGKQLGDLVSTTTLWASSDALGAIIDIDELLQHRTDTKAETDLAKREKALAADRAAALAEVASAEQLLNTKFPAPDTPAVPSS